ncbi:MAG: Uma2 family endonuclease [Moorea sp. SIO4G2]|uniref:Uma2 family endonuclease n=1 Tax=unclassified Moorena TaxID=2683338 RepID=UPI0013FC55CA|nr:MULTISPECIES: Uma2 family endonuclease [unclassified Moorena]NEO14244.1 Uma2 family endonuclease [Moorena sp. SIO3E8]NEO65961.1 Uma2 family endonuclease [Moorena sp. SIO4G2]NEQ00192.1 Uma2 family endonuclease [Moorena sp. SIO3F7]
MVTQINNQTSEIIYPESDGLPLADNTLQFRLITTIQGGIDALFKDNPNVFVAGDLFWYPVEGEPNTKQAPDVMVVFGRPKGDRRSYKQWEEDNRPPQVVFEIASWSNTKTELEDKKFRFYQRYGVEEYYIFDPEQGVLKGWLRSGKTHSGKTLEAIDQMSGWVSPRLKVRFELSDQTLQLYQPNGERFATYVEIVEQREQERQDKELQRQRAQRAETALEQAETALEQAEAALVEEQRRAQALSDRLKALGIDPDQF